MCDLVDENMGFFFLILGEKKTFYFISNNNIWQFSGLSLNQYFKNPQIKWSFIFSIIFIL